MKTGVIIEYTDQQKFICAVVLAVKDNRLRLLTETNREVNLSAGRVAHQARESIDPDLNRDVIIAKLKAVAARRTQLMQQLNLEEIWDVLNTEEEWIDLPTMTALCFNNGAACDHESAIMRAVFANRRFFKFDHNRFRPYTPAHVEQLIKKEKEALKRQQFVDDCLVWLRQVIQRGKPSPLTPDQKRLAEILKSYFLHHKKSTHADLAKEILKGAGIDPQHQLFDLLVQIGAFGVDENIELLRHEFPVEFPSEVVDQAQHLSTPGGPKADKAARKDFTRRALMTIDGQATLDFDDAVSIEDRDDHWLVGIHIADVGHYVKKDDLIDKNAIERASSIYMPDQKIPMLPPVLAENICSLKIDQIRPAISTEIRFSKTVRTKNPVIDFAVVPSLVRVENQLSYWDANSKAQVDPAIKSLFEVARLFRQWRLDQGAVQISLPEIHIWIDENGGVCVNRINRESPARLLVAEIMIMANWCFSRFLANQQLPAVFRTQAEPRQRLFRDREGTLYENWMQRRHLSRFILSPNPGTHSGLGLDSYVTATSPIRKYVDLLTQRQIRAALGLETPYSPSEIADTITQLALPMSAVGQIQRSRHRYWLLKHLTGHIGQPLDALVLRKKRNGYQVLLPKYMLECDLPASESIKLMPGTTVEVTLQHVHPRNDKIHVHLT
jgi:exoribonuclease-2